MNIERKYNAVIFDLDGTLVDTLQDLADSVNQALEKLSLPTHPVDSFRLKVGSGARNMVSSSLPAEGQDIVDSVLQMQKTYYAKHLCDHTQPYRQVPEMLRSLKGCQYKLAVLSNKPDLYTRQIVEHFFGSDTFDIVRGHCCDMPLKPDPAVPLNIIRQLGTSREQTVFVGDSSIDMQTANRAGMFAVGVTWGFRDREELVQNGCQSLIDQPDQLVTLLNQ